MRFSDRIALVTGAGRGIGLATALQLAREGAFVIASDCSEENLTQAADAMQKENLAFETALCDVADEESVRALVARIEKDHGRIDILINNAGVFRVGTKPFIEQTSEDWKLKININILGTFYCAHAVLPGMVERRYGKIVNLASVAGVYGLRRMVDYSATKGAVIAFTKALAKEVSPYQINVNAVSPGNIKTHTDLPQMSFMERSGTAEECAQVICFLASDEASFVSGQNYQVDGCRKTM